MTEGISSSYSEKDTQGRPQTGEGHVSNHNTQCYGLIAESS